MDFITLSRYLDIFRNQKTKGEREIFFLTDLYILLTISLTKIATGFIPAPPQFTYEDLISQINARLANKQE